MAFKIFKTETILGIGIGFILSAVIVGFFPTEQPITNKEIIRQAKELGMLTQEEHKELVQKEVEKVQGVRKKTPDRQPDPKTAPKTVTITIPKGADSDEIARILIDAGVKTDKESFQKAVIEMQAQRNFQVGDFVVPVEGDIKEVVDILTHRPKG